MADFQSELKSFSKRLELLNQNIEIMKRLGVDEDILVAYLCHRLKISEKKTRQMLHSIEEFYDKLIKTGMAKTLKKNG
jgi:ribosomal 50S subunit-associated protein YjgA (DUF615 family)